MARWRAGIVRRQRRNHGAMPLFVAARDGQVEVVAAGGVTGESAARLLEATGVPAIHGSCSHTVTTEGEMGEVPLGLGKPGAGPEDRRLTMDPESAGRFVAAARGGPS